MLLRRLRVLSQLQSQTDETKYYNTSGRRFLFVFIVRNLMVVQVGAIGDNH